MKHWNKLLSLLCILILFNTASASEQSLNDKHEKALLLAEVGAYEESMQLMSESASAGYLPSIIELGDLFNNLKIYDVALKYLRVAADMGDSVSSYNAATMYRNGLGTPVDRALALEYSLIAARGGVAEAQYNVAIAYDHARGLERNTDKAFFWYQKAAEQGIQKAQHNLAEMFKSGEGTVVNLEEAFRWYLSAANSGYAPSQTQVGASYLLGNGVPKNVQEGYAWLYIASQNGYEIATSTIEQIKSVTNPNDIAMAKYRATEILDGISK